MMVRNVEVDPLGQVIAGGRLGEQIRILFPRTVGAEADGIVACGA